MQRQHTLITIAVVACWIGLAWAGQPSPTPPNWGQVDFQGDWACPAMPSGTYADIPNLSLNLTTSGGPLLVMANLNLANVTSQPQAAFLVPAIDGQALENDRLRIDVSSVTATAFERMYPVPTGTHTVGLRMTCPVPDSGLHVWRGWLSVYELPSTGR
jgi:hypothetical protein